MKRMLLGIAALAVLATVSGCVVHETTPPPAGYNKPAQRDIHARIKEQQARIDQGVRSGQLTYAEADILQGNLNHVRSEYARMKADSRISPREYDRLDAMLDQNDEMIYRKRHNSIRRLY